MAATQASSDLDPTTWPTRWRDDWEVKECSWPAPRVWHRSGLCFFFEFEQVDEQGNWGWVSYNDDVSESRLYELRDELGEEAFTRFCALLGRQARAVCEEHGYADFKLAP